MIDPLKITNFNRTEYELQEFILFAIVVAGKNATIQNKKLSDFLLQTGLTENIMPFELIKLYIADNKLTYHLERTKLGQYSRLEKAFKEIINLYNIKSNIREWNIDDLEKCFGIGPKTARFFLLHSKPNMEVAVLDTHILKYLKSLGYNAPKNTPNKKTYKYLEQVFIKHAKNMGKSLHELDLEIWSMYKLAS